MEEYLTSNCQIGDVVYYTDGLGYHHFLKVIEVNDALSIRLQPLNSTSKPSWFNPNIPAYSAGVNNEGSPILIRNNKRYGYRYNKHVLYKYDGTPLAKVIEL